jgi:hypothetical protein
MLKMLTFAPLQYEFSPHASPFAHEDPAKTKNNLNFSTLYQVMQSFVIGEIIEFLKT